MWKTYKLSIMKSEMHFISRTIVWIMIWQWIGFLMTVAVEQSIDVMIASFLNIVFMYVVIMFSAKSSQHRIPAEAYAYLSNFINNKPNEIKYFVPDGCEPDDHSKWIYKV